MAVGKKRRTAGAGPESGKQKKEGDKGESKGASTDKATHIDNSSVFIRGLPKGTADQDLRTWLEGRIGPTVTCFVIRDDYGLAKFKEPNDAGRCLAELQGAEFQDSTLRLEAAKPKRQSVAGGGGRKAENEAEPAEPPAKKRRVGEDTQGNPNRAALETASGADLRSIQLRGVPQSTKKESLKAWVEARLPGGCGLEGVRRVLGEGADNGGAGSSGTFVVTFRKQLNATRALEALHGAELDGQRIAASYRALEMGRSTSKAGRLIVRNLAFSATEKHVRKAFSAIGSLEQVHLPLKPSSDVQHRGFAFVQYTDATAAQKAIEQLNGTKVCGRGVAVDWAVDNQLYSSLQREEQQLQQAQQQKKTQGKKAEKCPESGPEDDNDDEDDAEGEEEEDDDEEGGQEEDATKERDRMKKLLNEDGDDDEEDEDDEDEDEEEEEEEGDEEDGSGKGKKRPKAEAKDARKPGFDVDEGCTIFVRNVPFDATEQEVRDVFKRFGRLASVKMVADKTGQNAHRGSCFVKFKDTEGSAAALAAEAEADRKLKELSAVVRKSDRRELPAVDGFGISLKGRRLVLKQALSPKQMDEIDVDKKDKKDKKDDRRQWMHLLNVGRIQEGSEKWNQLSKSEQRQRAASAKERKFRINNPNWVLDPTRLSIRNLPRNVDVTKLRDAVVNQLSSHAAPQGIKKTKQRAMAQKLIQKVSLVRDDKRRTAGDESARRSKGFGFIAFKDHDSAMKTLEFLNDNPGVFGGARRPIVEFAVEDKRKLRMQQELYKKHAHKLKPELKENNKGNTGKGKEENPKPSDPERPQKKNKNKVESRGRRQREKRRAQKAAEADKAKSQETAKANWTQMQARRAEQKAADKLFQKKAPKKRDLPDAGLPAPNAKKARKAKDGMLADDFELRAMERFRKGLK